MHQIEIYMIKSIFIAGVYYLFYLLFLRRMTLYSWNRIYLILAVMQSVLFPLLKTSYFVTPLQEVVSVSISPILVKFESGSKFIDPSPNLIQILVLIYIGGATFLTFRFLSSLSRILYLYLRFPRVNYEGIKIVVLKGDQPSFTFFNILFVSEHELKGERNEVFCHELAHRAQWHSVDLFFMEIVIILQWFNPFVWLYRSSLRSQHEYAADFFVLKKGFDPGGYQQLLFERAVGVSPLGLINYFNHSLLKKRLAMINKTQSKSRYRIRFMLSVPVLFAVMAFIMQPFVGAQDDKVFLEVDKMPEYPGGIPAVRKHIAENIQYPESAKASKTSAKIYVSFVVDEQGKVTQIKAARTDILEPVKDGEGEEIVVVGYEKDGDAVKDPQAITDLENEAIRVIQTLGDWEPGMSNGKYVKVQYTFPIQFLLE